MQDAAGVENVLVAAGLRVKFEAFVKVLLLVPKHIYIPFSSVKGRRHQLVPKKGYEEKWSKFRIENDDKCKKDL